MTRRAAALGATVLLAAGCGASHARAPAHPSASRTTERLATGATRRALAARYLVIARAGNRRLEADLDPLEGRDRNVLARARADLRDAAATERLFDRRLLRIPFPAESERVARELARVNELRARLTTAAAASTTLHALRTYEPLLDAANAPVERSVTTLRRQLGLRPPSAS